MALRSAEGGVSGRPARGGETPLLPPRAAEHDSPRALTLLRRPRNFFPVEVTPRSSRCLCTGLQIQLMRGSWRRGNTQDVIVRDELRKRDDAFFQPAHGWAEQLLAVGGQTELLPRSAARGTGSSFGAATHVADGVVRRVHEDDLEVLVGGVLPSNRKRQLSVVYAGTKRRLLLCGGSSALTSFTQYEFSTRRPPHLRPARSSATLLRLRLAFSCMIPWFTGFPYTCPCAHYGANGEQSEAARRWRPWPTRKDDA